MNGATGRAATAAPPALRARSSYDRSPMVIGDPCPACANGVLKLGNRLGSSARDEDGKPTGGTDALECRPAFDGERSCGSEWVREADGSWRRLED